MKKNETNDSLWRIKPKILLIMKLTMILLGVFTSLSAATLGQTTTIKLNDVELQVVFNEIRDKMGYTFVYNDQVVKRAGTVSIHITSDDVRQILDRCLEGKFLDFYIEDRVIVILSKTGEMGVEPEKKFVTVRGKVVDEMKQPMPGVTVLVKGTRVGQITDKNGEFVMLLSDTTHAELVFSFVGMESQTIAYKNVPKKGWVIVLKEDLMEIDEVVVTGYGNVSKRNYTGATTTVQAKDIMMAGASSIDQMLQGVIPGMLVMNSTGMVGATPKIRVRGTSTLLGSQEPVWVVDGVIQQDPQPFNSEDNTKFSMDADDIRRLAGNAISWLNPNDIESITVLKDASATAIYGSKAANGVIVITTKKANVGKVSVNYNGDFSIGQRPRYGLYDLMNSQEMMQFSKEIYDERRVYLSPVLPVGYAGLLQKWLNKEISLEEMDREYGKMARLNTDWFKLLFKNSFNHSHNVSISSGSEKILNRTSFGYMEESGEAKGNSVTMFSATSNTTVNFGDRFMMNVLLKGSTRDVNGFAYGVDPFDYAYNTTRVIPAYQEDGSYYYHEKEGARGEGASIMSGRYNYNILNELENTGSKNSTRTWGTTIDLKWRILPGLEYQGLFSYTSSSSDSKTYASERSFYITQIRGYEYGSVSSTGDEVKQTPLPNGGVLETDLVNTRTIMVRNSLVYDRLFSGMHRMTLQLGIETNAMRTKGNSTKRYGYLPDRGETFTVPPSFFESEHGMLDNSVYVSGDAKIINRVDNKLSEYVSAVYAYDERYVLNFSARLDASNRFAQDKNKRFEPTWSIGAKWRLAQESFLLGLLWLENLDLYGSYGYQGNAVTSVSPYLIANDGGFDPSYKDYVMIVKSLPYPKLGWEKTKTYNIGVDASFLRGRLNLTANYFEKVSDVLASRDVPLENGDQNGIVSGSTIKNYGYDFVVDVVPVRTKNFTWQFSVNTSVTRNKVDKNKRINRLNNYTDGTAIVDSRPFSTFYSYQFDGLNPENGKPLFKNMDVENAPDPTGYLVESGKLTPDFSGGLNMMFKYKQLSLYALFAVQWGGDNRLPQFFPGATVSKGSGLTRPEQNVSRKLLHRWKNAGDDVYTSIPSLPGGGDDAITLPSTGSIGGDRQSLYSMYDLSDVRVANTDFIRCRSLSLAYEVSNEWLKQIYVQRMQIKVSMTNPFMWVADKKWDGLDPETGNWPARRMTSLSLQVMF